MAASIIFAKRYQTKIIVRVLIDDTKLLEDGTTPDPKYVIKREYPWPRPDGYADNNAYIAAVRTELRTLVSQALDAVATDSDGTDLGLVGQAP